MRAKVAIYVRQSLDVAEGIDRQLARCRALAAQRGWTVREEYRDNDTSASKVRGAKSGWTRMLAAIRAGNVDTVVAVDMDRLLRSMRDLVALTDLGVKVVTVSGEIDTASADGAFRAQMLAAIAEFEVKRKAERQTRANEHRVSVQGLPVPGRRRFGFEPGNILERSEEANVVRQMFADVLAGVPIFAIAKSVDREPARVREILANPSYAGWVVRGGEKFEAAPEVARIVERDDWEAVAAILADPSRKTSPGNQPLYLASGLARCGVCGSRMVKQSVNYLCKTSLAHPTIKQSMLDEHLKWEAFSYIASQDHTMNADVIEWSKRLAELTRKRAVQQDMATWDGADTAAIRSEIAKLGKDIEAAETSLALARSASIVEDTVNALRSELTDQEGADWWNARWETLGLSGQRQILLNLDIRVANGRGLDRVTVTPR